MSRGDQVNGPTFLDQVESGQIETHRKSPIADRHVAEQVANLLDAGLVSVRRMARAFDTTIEELDKTFVAHGIAFRTGFTEIS